MTTGLFGGAVLVGVTRGVSVKLGVGVSVGSWGVGENAATVCVNILLANCAAVPIISTGVDVAFGLQAVLINAKLMMVTIGRNFFLFTLSPVNGSWT